MENHEKNLIEGREHLAEEYKLKYEVILDKIKATNDPEELKKLLVELRETSIDAVEELGPEEGEEVA